MLIVRLLLVAMALSFIALCVWASQVGDFGAAFGAVFALPWGVVAMTDLYFGFILFAVIIFAVERPFVALPVILAVILLGNAISAIWLAWRLPDLWIKLKQG